MELLVLQQSSQLKNYNGWIKNSSLIAADSKIGCLDLSQDPREKENMIAKSKHFHLFLLQRYWYLREKDESPGKQKHRSGRKK